MTAAMAPNSITSNHASVDLARMPWLADVGFGEGFLEPLRMDSREEQSQNGRFWTRQLPFQTGTTSGPAQGLKPAFLLAGSVRGWLSNNGVISSIVHHAQSRAFQAKTIYPLHQAHQNVEP